MRLKLKTYVKDRVTRPHERVDMQNWRRRFLSNHAEAYISYNWGITNGGMASNVMLCARLIPL